MKKLILFVVFMAWASFASAAEYWVYVRLEDRAGVTAADDVGRSKAGDVVAVLPVTPQFIPSENEKKEWNIFKADLTKAQVEAMTQPWQEEKIDEKTGDKIFTPVAYRRNKIDTTVLQATKPGLVETKVTADKIQLTAKNSLDLARYSRNQKFYAWVQRPLWILDNKITRPAFASTVVSTINKTGEDYNTLTLWEDAKDGDLVTATTIQEADCYDDDGALSDSLSIEGSTTSASYYFYITTPLTERHNGTIANGFKITSAQTCIYVGANQWTIIDGLIANTNGFTADGGGTIAHSANGSDTLIIRNCIIYATNVSGSRDGCSGVVGFGNNDGATHVYNCVIYGYTGGYHTPSTLMGIYVGADYYTHLLYNNTVYGCGTGIKRRYGTVTATNNLVYNNTVDFSGSIGGDYNFSKDDTAPGANSIHGDTDGKTPDFVDAVIDGGEDFHLQATSDAIDVGTDLGTGFYDIDGYDMDLAATWDIGADEYVGGEPPAGRTRRMFISMK